VSAAVQTDRYRVIRPIASGGMGRVVLAEDQLLARQVALKRLHTGGDERELVRLRREAQVGASLSHPNLVSVHDVFFDEHDLVVVMEYVEGETLRDAMRRGALAPARALQVLGAMAAALDHIHERGVIHRDVKPANVLLRSDGVVKLGDLGVASAQDRTRITTSGTVLGTASYMAPEQLEGHPASREVDIYALAAVAFEAFSGRRARPETNPLALARAIATGPPPDILTVWPDAPPAAAAVLRRGMASHPQDRPRTAGELMSDLDAAIEPGLVGPAAVGAAAAAAAAADADPVVPSPLGVAEASSPEAVRAPPAPAPVRRVPPAPGDAAAGLSQDPASGHGPDARPPAPTVAQTALRRGPASQAPGAPAAVVAPAAPTSTPTPTPGDPTAGPPRAPRPTTQADALPCAPRPPDGATDDRRSAAVGTPFPPAPVSAPPRARRRWPALGAVAAVLAAGGVTAAVLASGTGSRSTARRAAAAPAASGAGAHAGRRGAPAGGARAGAAPAPRPGAATGGAQAARLSPATGTAGSGDPVSALESFYGLAARHNYSAAWNLADASMRSQVAGYSSFSSQQSAVHSITFNRASVLSSNGSQATVSLATTPVLDRGTQHCQGTAGLIKAASGWVMDHIAVSCTTPQPR